MLRLLVTTLALFFASSGLAQNIAVQADKDTGVLWRPTVVSGNLTVPSGKTATFNGTLTGTPTGGTLDLASLSLTLPAGQALTSPNIGAATGASLSLSGGLMTSLNGGYETDGYGGIFTRLPVGWASGATLQRFRFSRDGAPNPEGVPEDFMFVPYQHGMAIEYPGLVEAWVSKWSIKGNWDGMPTNSRPPELWVGDHGDTGGVFFTAWNHDDGFAASTWSEIASAKFDNVTSHGPLRLRVVSASDSFQFRQGTQALSYPTNTDTHSTIVAEISGTGALTLQDDLSVNPGTGQAHGYVRINAGGTNNSYLSLLSDSSQKWLISNAGATNRFTVGKSTGAATFTEFLGIDYDTGAATFSAGIRPGTDGSGIALHLAQSAALRSLNATSAGIVYVDVANVTVRNPSAAFATTFSVTPTGIASPLTTEATPGGAGAITTAGGIYAAKKIVSAAGLQVGGTNSTALDFMASASATLDFSSIAANASADLTITVTGAATGDSVHLGLPGAPASGIVFNAFVSAANTVTVRAFNVTGSAVDPASASYRATVTSF